MRISFILRVFVIFPRLLNVESFGLNLCHVEPYQINFENYYKYKKAFPQVCGKCGRSCVRKCCSHGFYIDKAMCIQKQSNFSISMFEEEKYVEEYNGNGWIIGTMLNCDYFPLVPSENPSDGFYVQKNGFLWVPQFGRTYNINEYCLDSLGNGNQIALICFPRLVLDFTVKNSGEK